MYVDALVLRDRDATGSGTLSERLWVQQDANWNVTALVNGSGSVVERYVYDPYGSVTVLSAAWGSLSGSAYAWIYRHQGGRLDTTTGVYDFRNRDESPALGRWVEVDPSGFAAGDVNLFRYIGNAPLGQVDPNGLARTLPRNQWPRWVKDLVGQNSGRDEDEGGSGIEEVTEVAEDLQHEGGGHYDVHYRELGTGAERKQRYHRDGRHFTDEENQRITDGGGGNHIVITTETVVAAGATVVLVIGAGAAVAAGAVSSAAGAVAGWIGGAAAAVEGVAGAFSGFVIPKWMLPISEYDPNSGETVA